MPAKLEIKTKTLKLSPFTVLPKIKLTGDGPLSNEFLRLGITDSYGAYKTVLNLPYGRTSDPSDWRLVLSESKGTCSTKHALIAALGEELGLDIKLTLILYPMSGANTIGVEKILEDSGYDYIPEAHCVLTYNGQTIDLTRQATVGQMEIEQIFYREFITPDQIGSHKQRVHLDFLKEWVGEDSLEAVWEIREKCIAAFTPISTLKINLDEIWVTSRTII